MKNITRQELDGQLVKRYRKMHDLSRREFAIRAGVSAGAVDRIENAPGPVSLNPSTYNRIVGTVIGGLHDFDHESATRVVHWEYELAVKLAARIRDDRLSIIGKMAMVRARLGLLSSEVK